MKIQTREQWLEAAVQKLQPLFKQAEYVFKTEFPSVRVSVGWPSKGGTAKKSKVIGQCWSTKAASDGVAQVFISPTMGEDLVHTLGVLVHELVHAWDDCASGHKGKFAIAAKTLGLVGKMTESNVGESLRTVLQQVIDELGEFPHAPLIPSEMDKERKKQTTRMIKLVAPDCCDYTVRTTQKWIDEGLPLCPHNVTMEVA